MNREIVRPNLGQIDLPRDEGRKTRTQPTHGYVGIVHSTRTCGKRFLTCEGKVSFFFIYFEKLRSEVKIEVKKEKEYFVILLEKGILQSTFFLETFPLPQNETVLQFLRTSLSGGSKKHQCTGVWDIEVLLISEKNNNVVAEKELKREVFLLLLPKSFTSISLSFFEKVSCFEIRKLTLKEKSCHFRFVFESPKTYPQLIFCQKKWRQNHPQITTFCAFRIDFWQKVFSSLFGELTIPMHKDFGKIPRSCVRTYSEETTVFENAELLLGRSQHWLKYSEDYYLWTWFFKFQCCRNFKMTQFFSLLERFFFKIKPFVARKLIWVYLFFFIFSFV